MSVSEVATKIGINKSTTYQMLNTFRAHGFVQKNRKDSRYQLGYRIVELAIAFLDTVNVRDLARPFLEFLREKTNETVNLMILDETANTPTGVYVEILQSSQALRMVASVGTREELYCTGIGKAILAFLPQPAVGKVIQSGLMQRTRNTIIDPEILMDHLAEIRQSGYSIDDEEAEDGIRCVGAPVFNHRREVVAGISVAVPAHRWDVGLCHRNAPEVIEAAQSISRALGQI